MWWAEYTSQYILLQWYFILDASIMQLDSAGNQEYKL